MAHASSGTSNWKPREGDVLTMVKEIVPAIQRSSKLWLYGITFVALMIVAMLTGAHYDYPSYMSQWSRVLGGFNPWIGDPDNVYGPGHQLLALLFCIHIRSHRRRSSL
jgi:hypothetical protein